MRALFHFQAPLSVLRSPIDIRHASPYFLGGSGIRQASAT
jgi:hypothetical protein